MLQSTSRDGDGSMLYRATVPLCQARAEAANAARIARANGGTVTIAQPAVLSRIAKLYA